MAPRKLVLFFTFFEKSDQNMLTSAVKMDTLQKVLATIGFLISNTITMQNFKCLAFSILKILAKDPSAGQKAPPRS